MITAIGLKLFVYPALTLTCIAPVILIYLMFKDSKEGKIW